MRDNNYRQKCFYVGVMLRRMIEAMLNKDAMDDKVITHNLLSGNFFNMLNLFEVWFLTFRITATWHIRLAKAGKLKTGWHAEMAYKMSSVSLKRATDI